MTIDLTDPAIRHDPYPLYAHLRATRPVTRARVPLFGEAWLVTRYDDVVRGLKHPGLTNDLRNTDPWLRRLNDAWWLPTALRGFYDNLLSLDDPAHRRLRNLVHQAFTPARVDHLAGEIARIADDLLDHLPRTGPVDLVADYALPLPLRVISTMLGVPPGDHQTFHTWSSRFLDVGVGDLAALWRQIPNTIRMRRFFARLIALRRTQPGDDLLTGLIQANEAGDRLSQDELVAMIFLLLLAGHETTVNLIATGVLTLLQHPDQLQQLREQPALIDRAIEEVVRFGNPVEFSSIRSALTDVDIGAQVIRPGSRVIFLLASANRDAQIFANPEHLDITRDPNRHVGFGFGIHYCLGVPLARLEGRLAIQKLIARFPRLQLAIAPEQLAWRRALAVRGLRSLPVVLG